MLRNLMLAAIASAALAVSTSAFAQGSGTAAEAKALLERTAAAVKADKAKALAAFNAGLTASRTAISILSVSTSPTAS